MIENLRKYTVLIIILFVLVIIGFVLMDTSNMSKSQGGVPALKIAGRTYTDGDLNKYGANGYQLTMAIVQSGDYQLFGFLTMLAGDATSESEISDNFFSNRMLLRAAKEEFGIYPSEQEIDSKIRSFRVFTSADGAFSQEQYRNFIERGLGRLGLAEADIRDLASDIIVHGKISDILSAGLSSDRNIVAKQVAIDGQRINAKLARIDIAPLKTAINPSEDDIKKYWETVQDAFKTEEKRKFTYFIAKPTLPAEPAAIAALPKDADAAAKTEHDKKVAERDAAIAEGKRIARLNTGKLVDDLLYQLETQEALDFKNLATEKGFKLQTTELIAKSQAPADLLAESRGSKIEGSAAEALFRLAVTSDPASKIIDLAIGENDWLVAYVDEVEVSRVKTYDEAKPAALGQLSADLAAAALTKAANEAQEKVKTALAEKKSFEDAAKAAGITAEISSLTETNSTTQFDTTKYPVGFFEAAKYTTPGELTEPIIETDRAFIVLVEKREFVKDANTENTINNELKSEVRANGINAFEGWLKNKAEASNVERLNRKK